MEKAHAKVERDQTSTLQFELVFLRKDIHNSTGMLHKKTRIYTIPRGCFTTMARASTYMLIYS
jgi:hypothetical protein